MKKFRFTLQTLYNVKSTEETEARTRLAEIIAERDKLNEQLEEIKRLYQQRSEEYHKECKRGISGTKVREYGRYFQYLGDERKKLEAMLRECELRLEQCQRVLLKLINEKKVLDRMRDEQLEEYKKEVRADEDKTLEDFISGHRE